MKNGTQAIRERRVTELAADYARQGYRVVVQPEPGALPFDLGGYRPDLLAERDDDHVLVQVRGPGARDVERVVQAAEEVRAHPGWRFLLVAGEEPNVGGPPAEEGRLLSWDEMRDRLRAAERIAPDAGGAASFLVLWSTFEALLRRHAENAGLPFERLPTSSLLKQLYSYGELSIPQYDAAMAALNLRDRVAHGFAAGNLTDAPRSLASLVQELLAEWAPRSEAA